MKFLLLMLTSLLLCSNAFSDEQDLALETFFLTFKHKIENQNNIFQGIAKVPAAGSNKTYVYTICKEWNATLFIGKGGGDCIGLSIDENGVLNYMPLQLTKYKVGASGELKKSVGAYHRIIGASGLDDLVDKAQHVIGSSVQLAAGVNINWANIFSDIDDLKGNFLDLDFIYGVGADILSYTYVEYNEYNRGQFTRSTYHLTTEQILKNR